MHFLKSVKIWFFTNVSGAFILTVYMAVTGKSEGEFVTEFLGLFLFMAAFGLLFSLPAIPVMFLTLQMVEHVGAIPAKIILLLLGNAFSVFAVLILTSSILDMKITSDYGENLLEFTWPQTFTSFISTFLVMGHSIIHTNNQHTNLNSEENHAS